MKRNTSLLCASSRTITMLLLLRFFQAFGISIGSVVTQTILRDCFSGHQRNKIFSIVSIFLGLAPAIGPIIGGITVQYGQWRANFIVLTLAGIATLIYALWRLPETRPVLCAENKVGYFALLRRMLCDRHIIGSLLLVGIFNGILFSYYAHAPFIFINLFHLLPSHYGMLGIALALAISR
ncbi:MAG: multidrug effflux MFS transporter [Gammaproteobacteria bacterium]|nr:multidrug effflux MFS transporter [Gammaproteobacteria bacterium]